MKLAVSKQDVILGCNSLYRTHNWRRTMRGGPEIKEDQQRLLGESGISVGCEGEQGTRRQRWRMFQPVKVLGVGSSRNSQKSRATESPIM